MLGRENVTLKYDTLEIMLECRPVATSLLNMGDQCMKLYPHIFRAKAILTFLLVFYHHLKIKSQSIKPMVEQLSHIFHDSFISRKPHLITGLKTNRFSKP